MVDDSIFAGPARPIGGGSDDDSIFAGPARPIGGAEEKPSLLNTPSVSKSFIEGAGEGILGAAELIPGTIHNKAVEWEGKLHEDAKAHPWAESAGQIAPLFVPGAEAAGALLPARAVRAGEGVLDWGKGLIGSMARGSVKGAAGGAEAGALAPTGQEDYKKSLKEKERAAEAYGTAGAALGPVVGAVRPIVSGIKQIVPALTGSEVKSLSKALTEKASGKATEAVTEESAKEQEALKRAAQINTNLETQTAEMNRIVKAQQDLSIREATRAEAATLGRNPLTGATIKGSRDVAQALDPQKVVGIRSRVSEELRLRTIDAQEAAKQAGLSSEQARAFVIEQELKVTEAEKAAQALSDDLTANAGSMDANALGRKLQDTADGIYKRLIKERETRAGFGEAVSSAGNELRVPTNQAVSFIDGKMANIRNPDTRAVLERVKRELQTSIVDENGKPKAVAQLNLRSADSVRKYIDDLLESEEKSIQGTGTAVGKEARAYLSQIKKIVVDSARQSWAPYDKAMTTFAELSKPLNAFERKGPMASIVRTDEKTREFKLLEGEVTARLLAKTSKGANAVARLIQEKPELKEDLRAYFQHQLYGPEGLTKSITPDRMKAFMTRNEAALKQTGLYKDFNESRKHLEEAHDILGKAKEAAKAAKEKVLEPKVAEEKAAQKVVESERSLTERAAKREEEITKAKPVDTEKAASDRAKDAATRLRLQEAAKKEDITRLKREFDTFVKEGKASSDLSQKVNDLDEAIHRKGLTSAQVASRVEKTFKALRDEGKISEEELHEGLVEIDKFRGAVAKEAKVRDIARRALLFAAIATSGYAIARDIHITLGLF